MRVSETFEKSYFSLLTRFIQKCVFSELPFTSIHSYILIITNALIKLTGYNFVVTNINFVVPFRKKNLYYQNILFIKLFSSFLCLKRRYHNIVFFRFF